MSYAASYALYNYYLENPSLGTSEYSNLRLVRAFEHGLDPKSSEAGFILTHIHMVQETGPLISGAVSLLKTIESKPEEVATARSGVPDDAQRHGEDRSCNGIHVVTLSAKRLHQLPNIHLWNHESKYVSERCHLRGRERRQAHVLPR